MGGKQVISIMVIRIRKLFLISKSYYNSKVYSIVLNGSGKYKLLIL